MTGDIAALPGGERRREGGYFPPTGWKRLRAMTTGWGRRPGSTCSGVMTSHRTSASRSSEAYDREYERQHFPDSEANRRVGTATCSCPGSLSLPLTDRVREGTRASRVLAPEERPHGPT